MLIGMWTGVDLRCRSVKTFNKNNKPNNATGQQFLCSEGWFSSCSKEWSDPSSTPNTLSG